MKFGHLEVQLLLDMGMLLYLTSNNKKKWALPYPASGYTILVLKQQRLNNFFCRVQEERRYYTIILNSEVWGGIQAN